MKIRLVNLKINKDNYRFFTIRESMLDDIQASLHNVFKAMYNNKFKISISYIDFTYHDMTIDDEENFYNFPMEQIAKTVNSKIQIVKVYAHVKVKNKNYYFTNEGEIVA